MKENQDCVNTSGSYKCVCSEGFEDKDGTCVQTVKPGKQLFRNNFLKKICCINNLEFYLNLRVQLLVNPSVLFLFFMQVWSVSIVYSIGHTLICVFLLKDCYVFKHSVLVLLHFCLTQGCVFKSLKGLALLHELGNFHCHKNEFVLLTSFLYHQLQ